MTANASDQEVAKRGMIIRPLASDILEEKIELAFDHLRIVLDAVERVRVELEVSDIAPAFVGTYLHDGRTPSGVRGDLGRATRRREPPRKAR